MTLADVARVESGLQSYAFGIRENGVPATAAAIQLSLAQMRLVLRRVSARG